MFALSLFSPLKPLLSIFSHEMGWTQIDHMISKIPLGPQIQWVFSPSDTTNTYPRPGWKGLTYEGGVNHIWGLTFWRAGGSVAAFSSHTLGIGPHSRRWAAGGGQVKLCLPLPIAHLTPEPPHFPPHSWKNCLLGNQFLMPKRLGTAGLWGLAFSSLNTRQKGKHDYRLTLYFPVIGSIYKDLL